MWQGRSWIGSSDCWCPGVSGFHTASNIPFSHHKSTSVTCLFGISKLCLLQPTRWGGRACRFNLSFHYIPLRSDVSWQDPFVPSHGWKECPLWNTLLHAGIRSLALVLTIAMELARRVSATTSRYMRKLLEKHEPWLPLRPWCCSREDSSQAAACRSGWGQMRMHTPTILLCNSCCRLHCTLRKAVSSPMICLRYHCRLLTLFVWPGIKEYIKIIAHFFFEPYFE